jgi:hypothetical protein
MRHPICAHTSKEHDNEPNFLKAWCFGKSRARSDDEWITSSGNEFTGIGAEYSGPDRASPRLMNFRRASILVRFGEETLYKDSIYFTREHYVP